MITSENSQGSRSAQYANTLATVRERIQSGTYAPGQWLPVERDLASEFDAPRRTVRRVIAVLAEEGLLECRPGYRPVVRSRPAESHRRVAVGRAANAASSALAESPSSAESRLVALVMWHGGVDQRSTAQERIFWGMNERLARSGYHGIFLDLGDAIGSNQENAEREAARLQYVLDHKFAGAIFYAYAYGSNRPLIQEVAGSVPLVLIDRMIPGIEADYVGVDNERAMFDAATYLISLGHRRIAYISNHEFLHTVHDRLQGYRRALASHEEGSLSEIVLVSPDERAESWSTFDLWFRQAPEVRPTAILCVNDIVAFYVYSRLSAAGLRVPEDVALAGFDNIAPTLPNGVGLTTIGQPFEEIGRAAADVFVERRVSPRAPALHRELAAPLIIRASCLPANTIYEPKF